MPDIPNISVPDTPSTKLGRTALPGHNFAPTTVRNANALAEVIKAKSVIKSASLKTPSTNIILDSEMVLNPTTLSVFFEKFAANLGKAVATTFSASVPSASKAITSSVKTNFTKNVMETGMKNIKPPTKLPSADPTAYRVKGGMTKQTKQSPIAG